MGRYKSFSQKDIAIRNKNKFPYNLLFDAMPELCSDRFEKVYIDHIYQIIECSFDDVVNRIIDNYWNLHMSIEEISKWTGYTESSVRIFIKDILAEIVENKDVIFNGIIHSKLGKKIKQENFSNINFEDSTVNNLIISGIYDPLKITSMTGSQLISILSSKLKNEDVGKTFADIVIKLNSRGYHTEHLGFPGKLSGTKILTEKELKDLVDKNKKILANTEVITKHSTTGITVDCPCCGKKLKISITEA